MKGRLRQRSPGSWEVSYDLPRDVLGKRQRRSLTVRGTKSQAERKLREILATVDKGGDPTPAKVRVKDWLDRWMDEVVVHRRQGTKERYRDIIDRYIVPHVGHVEVGKLNPAHVQALETRLSQQLAPKGVNQVHIVLSGAFKHAMRLELIQRNPVSLVSPPPVKRQEVPPPNIPAVREALSLAREEQHYLFAAMHLVAYTGLRRGEVLALLWDHVDLERGFLRVEGSLVRSAQYGVLLEEPKTNAGRRTVDLDDLTIEVLAQHRRQQAAMREALPGVFADQGKAFTNERGGWVNPQVFYKAVKAYGTKVGYDGMTVRSLRHFHASLMLQTGENIVVVSKRLGHANVSITSDIYAHALPGWQKRAADRFAEAMEAEGSRLSL